VTRYDKETLRSKIEWEGDEGITWFKSSEVPFELEDLWRDALNAHYLLESLMTEIMEALEDDQEQE